MLRKYRILLSTMLGLAFIGVYLAAIERNINERRKRSLELRDDAAEADNVLVSVTVMRADPTTRQLTARIRIQRRGGIARNAATPNIDLRFVVNNSPGQQVYAFPKGVTGT